MSVAKIPAPPTGILKRSPGMRNAIHAQKKDFIVRDDARRRVGKQCWGSTSAPFEIYCHSELVSESY